MKVCCHEKRYLFPALLIITLLTSACMRTPELFSGSLSTLPEGKEIRMEGILEKNPSKTGSSYYSLNGIWLTFDDDFPLEQLLGKKVTVKGKVVHFDNCKPWREAHSEIYGSEESYFKALKDPNFMEPQCMMSEQLNVSEMHAW